MMVEEHPTVEQLTAFGLGKLNDAESTALEAHLAECETCRQTLETQAADSFVALARAVRTEERTAADGQVRVASPGAPTCALTATVAPASTDVPPELADHPRYRILSLLGVGGMTARPRLNSENDRFARHLYNHAASWFMFLVDPTIPATNHRAEQALKTPIVNRKVWGGNRTDAGGEAQAIVCSVLQTCKNRAIDSFNYLRNAFHGVLGNLFA